MADAEKFVATGDPVALLRHLIRVNYHHAATAPPEKAMGYQQIADTLVTAHPATWTMHTPQMPASQVADQIAAALFIRLRTITVNTAEYRELDGIRRHFHQLRRTATHHQSWELP